MLGGFYERRVFPFLLERSTRVFAPDRDRLFPRARGRVLEIGVGGGASFPHYRGIDELIGIDPSPTLLERAEIAGRGVDGFDLQLVAGKAESLPFPDDDFDTVVCSLVFCSVEDPERAAAELARVLREDGELLVLEHVRSERPRVARWQSRLNPLWQPFSGCRLDRDTPRLLAEAGFDLSHTSVFEHADLAALVGTVLEGAASLSR